MEKIIKHIVIKNQSLLITDKNRFFIAENRYAKGFTKDMKNYNIYYINNEYKLYPYRCVIEFLNIESIEEKNKSAYIKYIL
jgi:hypothetical protein